MTRRLRWLVAVIVVLLLGYGGMLVVYPQVRPWRSFPGLKRAPSRDRTARRRRPQTKYTEISATIAIPPANEVGPLEGCPKRQLEIILDVNISHPHGLGIGEVTPDGPADRAGIRPGDHLAESYECPSTTIGHFLPRDEAREVSVTIRRPHQDAAEGEATGEGGEQVPEDEPVSARSP
jgi:hypothetical protein